MDLSNVAGIIQGQKDTPLNDHGREEAGLVSARLSKTSFIEIWSSSLSRASEVSPYLPYAPTYSWVEQMRGVDADPK